MKVCSEKMMDFMLIFIKICNIKNDKTLLEITNKLELYKRHDNIYRDLREWNIEPNNIIKAKFRYNKEPDNINKPYAPIEDLIEDIVETFDVDVECGYVFEFPKHLFRKDYVI